MHRALNMTFETAGAPGQTNVDAESFIQVDDLANAAANSPNGKLVANGYSIPQGITGDTSVRNSPVVDDEDASTPPSNTIDRKDDDDASDDKVDAEDTVSPRCDNVQDGNDNLVSSAVTDNASMIDAALEFTPPTAVDKVLLAQPNSSFPNQPRFAHSNPHFPVPLGYGMGGNPQTLGYEDSPTPFTSAAFPPMDIGNLFGRQSAFGCSPPQFYSPQTPVPATNLYPPRTEITPQALLSLEDALDRNSTPKSPKRVREELGSEVKDDEAESSSSVGKKTPSKRRKSNKVSTKAATTIGGVRYGGSAKKMMPRRTVSMRYLLRYSPDHIEISNTNVW